ncbi:MULTISPECIES: ABC transporter substrate-binding protein [Roseomonadaceae]|uniref:Extracellular solute-binding protein n=1 Tax=Falsiroseomonas oleicola TaxID=2801474 RepID=A0ABS6HDU7_9PROT|nr:extracellular solute-binding protein [Roseomonas oleicola]MBU8546889.1 extracellular solute-binding protein [Roseomonas oleicola]
MQITRRALLGSASATMLAAPALAQGRRFVIMSHAVHQRAVTGAAGGDSSAAWKQQAGVETEWLTFGVEAVHERVYREAALSQGGVDVAFLLDRYTGPHVAPLFEDLRPFMEAEPLETADEIAATMYGSHNFRGKQTGIPYRHATHGFFYNKALLRERGVEVPTTFAEIIAAADRLTHARADGTRVAGFANSMDDPSGTMDLIRAHGGDFITQDYRFVGDAEPAVRAVALLRDWFRRGVLPRNVMTFKTEEVITAMQQGRAAMTTQPFGRFINYNDARQSRFAGEIAVAPIPMAGSTDLAPAKTSVWAMAIPRNARDKRLSWSFIREVSSRASTIRAAVNGNGPVRSSAYDDPKVREMAPFLAIEQRVLPHARLTVPGFEQAGRSMDIFMEEVQRAMLGQAEPLAAMRSARSRIEPLLPA